MAAIILKKFATILLLLLLAFNFVGYRLLFSFLEKKADHTIAEQIDSDRYNDADLIMLTVPLSMPYIQDSKDFERKDGEITLNGKVYHYVEQKISQGNLVLMCLPDEEKTHLRTAQEDFFRLANELQNNTSSKKPGEHGQVMKLSISDYEEMQTSVAGFTPGPIIKLFSVYADHALLKGEGALPEHPPEA
ncbi:hypothetical protein [Parafilimonas sp.]|uniref:hypothetical protein n=1 Tax=Parafilimonas sp. TaxID=1969739 RepID=UPI0039E3B4A8